ncbi:MAG TPA: histidine-type phosphatase [Candidatus Acidoferrales bacterium]|nr:histidine-type phosphatase [Candidatus Acidoferrales bacterium]
MKHLISIASFFALALSAAAPAVAADAGSAAPAPAIPMVVVVSRHGVRSPTHPAELQPYARQPWATWTGHPGDLTAHGALLMRQFGASYRRQYGDALGIGTRGCPPAGSIFIWADVDQRTRATAEAVANGFAPGCGVAVGHASGDSDPLFDPLPGIGTVDAATAKAAVLGTAGGDLSQFYEADASAFATMERVLGCAPPAACKTIVSVPTTVVNKGDGGLASIKGGLDAAADVAENLLLEYVEGRPTVGWGRVDRATLVQMLSLHVLNKRLEHGNRYTARAHASNIMAHVLQTLQEGASGHAVEGTRVPPHSRFVFFAGHDTQLSELAGLLGLNWLVSGDAYNDTPPGSALVFELHAASAGAEPFVRTFLAEQSLDDMRAGHGERPSRVPVYVPGCPALDCPISDFAHVVEGAIDPSFVAPW